MQDISSDFLKSIGVSAKPQAKAGDNLGQKDFLKLMTAQIQQQDPFKPAENGDFLAQIAQFGTVDGIKNLEKSFSDFATSFNSGQAVQASSLVGRNIVVSSETFSVIPGKNSELQVDLSNSSSQLMVDITDSNGQILKTINLGQQAKGKVDFIWDGKLDNGVTVPAGTYGIKARALIGGKTVAMNTLVTEKVDSVTLGSGKQGLVLNTASKSYSFNEIKQVK